MTQSLVILDRDGVINEGSDGDYIRSVSALVPIKGSLQAIARLSSSGLEVWIATNQSGIGRGYYSEADCDAIHTALGALVAELGGQIAGVVVCPHAPGVGCSCRKPLPGLLHQISAKTGTDLHGVPFVGDSPTDIAAAEAAGCEPVLVLTGKGHRSRHDVPPGTVTFTDLGAFADAYLAGRAS